MSVRVYTGRHSDRGGAPRGWIAYIPWGLAGLTILGQIAWILTSGEVRTALTALTVVTFFLASVTHAYLNRGLAWTSGYVAISVGIGWLAEVIGLATQFPFGDYSYTDALGPAVLGVPILIPLAWSMMAYPCLLAAQRLVHDSLLVALVGGLLFASWDLFLDPQMVGQGYWVWNEIGWTLPGIDEIPLQNFLGWLLVAFFLMLALDRLPHKVAHDGVPTLMLSWTYVSNVLAAAVFFDRPGVALWGGIIMGAIVIPWWWRIWSQPQW